MTSSVIAIVGGRVLPMHGASIDVGTVVVRDGRIAAVGPSANVALPADAEIVRADGCWVLPGLIDPHTHVGVEEQSVGEPGDDLNEASRPDDAELRVIDGINPADQAFEDALAAGVTAVAVLPGSASPIGGQTALVKCQGRTVDEMIVRSPAGVKSALGENPKRVWATRHAGAATRPGIAAIIRRAFTAAQQAAPDGPQGGGSGTPAAALRRVLDGELSWHQHAHRADDIATALRLADEFGYRLVIHHGTEAHLLADILAARDIPVVCGP
ncbi:MAG TPA: amidohydrolase, partial [Jatrophihabitantaceae bacterium]|nr:amidohydrolase [Jatrophihabitantaceae bacterium]